MFSTLRDYVLVRQTVALYCTSRKKDLLTRDDLVLPWRPLYKLVVDVVYSPYEHHGLFSTLSVATHVSYEPYEHDS